MKKLRMLKKFLCFGITIGNLATSPALANTLVRAEYFCSDTVKDTASIGKIATIYGLRH